MRYCCVPGCQNRAEKQGPEISKEDRLTFHYFPKINPERCAQWAMAVGGEGWLPLKHSQVCSDHFEEKYFDRNDFRVRLRYGAVPTLRLKLLNKKVYERLHNSRIKANETVLVLRQEVTEDNLEVPCNNDWNSRPAESDPLALPSSSALTSMVMSHKLQHTIDGPQTFRDMNLKTDIHVTKTSVEDDHLDFPSNCPEVTSVAMQIKQEQPSDESNTVMGTSVKMEDDVQEEIDFETSFANFIKNEPSEKHLKPSQQEINKQSRSEPSLPEKRHIVKSQGDIFGDEELEFDGDHNHKVLYYMKMCDGRKLRLILSSPEDGNAEDSLCCDDEEMWHSLSRLIGAVGLRLQTPCRSRSK